MLCGARPPILHPTALAASPCGGPDNHVMCGLARLYSTLLPWLYLPVAGPDNHVMCGPARLYSTLLPWLHLPVVAG